jgi:hypothetical protein
MVAAVRATSRLQVVRTFSMVPPELAVDFGILHSGDVDGDQCVQLLDFSLLAGAFATCDGGAAYDPRADLTLDGCVTLLDFSLLAGNFGRCGDCESCVVPTLELQHVASTATQIALTWSSFPGAAGYRLERSSSADMAGASGYDLPSIVHAYGDTGRAPDAEIRWVRPHVLQPGETYYYRVTALRDGLDPVQSAVVSAQVSTGPTRGVSGDLYADQVIGQPDFGEVAFGKTTRDTVQRPGGAYLDKSATPNRLFVADTNHNRVLGFDHLGFCAPPVRLAPGDNLALGRPYQISTENAWPRPEWPDNGGELTNGQVFELEFWRDAEGLLYQLADPQSSAVVVDLDLGVGQQVNTVAVNSGGLTPTHVAASLEVFVRSDEFEPWRPVTMLYGESPPTVITARYDNERRDYDIGALFETEEAVRFLRLRLRTHEVFLALGEVYVGVLDDLEAADVIDGLMCTVDSECAGRSLCDLDPAVQPAVVFGQPAFEDASACNGDNTGQSFPAPPAASASSLCFTDPTQVSVAETVTRTSMAIDSDGALYVPDLYNHRVLRFADPFTGPVAGRAADQVIGQENFEENGCNRSAGPDWPAADTLCRPGGIVIDGDDNLWVADLSNWRVVRFPRQPDGSVAPAADVVLGQPDFQARLLPTLPRPLDRIGWVTDVAYDQGRNRLYVADATEVASDPGSRILYYDLDGPMYSGMRATGARACARGWTRCTVWRNSSTSPPGRFNTKSSSCARTGTASMQTAISSPSLRMPESTGLCERLSGSTDPIASSFSN